ncbi:MAG: hypothetical protein K6T88_15135 [Bacillus sp. (in: Bacteria)]|nr:hypothetical protein [Bacillus sp. (in: firmicutes)]
MGNPIKPHSYQVVQYERQLFIVYDLGFIQNEEEFKRDIESIDGVKLLVIKH